MRKIYKYLADGMSALIEYFENRDVLHVILSTKFEDSKTGPTYNNQDSFATPFFWNIHYDYFAKA